MTKVSSLTPQVGLDGTEIIGYGKSGGSTALATDIRTIRGELVINTVTGTTQTFAITDKGKLHDCTNASSTTVTLPDGIQVGTTAYWVQTGGGSLTFQDNGTSTVNSADGVLTADGNNRIVAATVTATDTWLVFGALTQSYLTDIVNDTTPQLGGSLDVNSQKIVSTANGDIDIEPNGTGNVSLGTMVFDADQTIGAGQDNYVLTYDNTAGTISLEAATGGGGALPLGADTTLTIASGAITVTKNFHKVAGEGAANDSLTTINGGVDGQLLLLKRDTQRIDIDAGSGNIVFPDRWLHTRHRMGNDANMIMLYYDADDTNWHVVSAFADGPYENRYGQINIGLFSSASGLWFNSTGTTANRPGVVYNDGRKMMLKDPAGLGGGWTYPTTGELTIATGAVSAPDGGHYTIDTEADAASDDLDTIAAPAGTSDGVVVRIRANNDARTVVVKHGTGNIYTKTAADVSLDTNKKGMTLMYVDDITGWMEV